MLIDQLARTPEWKNKTIDAETYLDLLLENVVPAIVANWPIGEWTNHDFRIQIQQDGAKAHTEKSVEVNFMEGLEDLAEQGMLPFAEKLELMTQPANLPDCNVNDLDFFRAIQSVFIKRRCTTWVGYLPWSRTCTLTIPTAR